MDPLIVGLQGLVFDSSAGRALLPSVLTPDEITLLLSSVRGRSVRRQKGPLVPLRRPRSWVRPRDHLLLAILYRYGLTTEEIGRLLVSDVDLAEETIHIRRADGTSHTYPLFLDLVPLCTEWQGVRWVPGSLGSHGRQPRIPPSGEDFLFPEVRIRAATAGRFRGVTARNIAVILVNAHRIARLDRPVQAVTPGALRRAIGAHLVAAGWTPEEVAYHLGLASEYAPSLDEYRERLRVLAASRWLARLL